MEPKYKLKEAARQFFNKYENDIKTMDWWAKDKIRYGVYSYRKTMA